MTNWQFYLLLAVIISGDIKTPLDKAVAFGMLILSAAELWREYSNNKAAAKEGEPS